MKIVEVAGGFSKPIAITPAEEEDFKLLTKKRFSFTWRSIKKSAPIYKLQIRGEDDILGAMGLIDIPGDKRIEIKLLSTSEENRGSKKIYEGIPGCLIAFACRLSQINYGPYACVSLIPKTELTRHYMKKYHMLYAGWQLYLEGASMNKLIQEYL